MKTKEEAKKELMEVWRKNFGPRKDNVIKVDFKGKK